MTLETLRWKKYPVLDDGFICLVDVMGDDSSIVQAARVSYGAGTRHVSDDRNLIRYLYRHGHATPFEMVEFKFLIRCPMDCWRQWIRHRTANVNEYSTRYSEAIDSAQKTAPDEWRAQAQANKQGSAGIITEWAEGTEKLTDLNGAYPSMQQSPGQFLSAEELELQRTARIVYETRLKMGVAREQARKDLPLSTYTEAYWKCDLRNILGFLSLRMDSHAQKEIRLYANAMYRIVEEICPLAIEAFDEYDMRREGLLLSATDVAVINAAMKYAIATPPTKGDLDEAMRIIGGWPADKKSRERDECIAKLRRLGMYPYEELK